ncbi:MAG: hypothetical protein NZ961_17675, partial [Candidatus Poribacteria bacterium]|nr:hypothetical protein [Candidatus Poribacteria bacterium]
CDITILCFSNAYKAATVHGIPKLFRNSVHTVSLIDRWSGTIFFSIRARMFSNRDEHVPNSKK